MHTGIVSNLNEKGFGFIEVEGYDKNIFFHASEVRGMKIEQLRKGDTVSMREILKTPKGYSAKAVSLVVN